MTESTAKAETFDIAIVGAGMVGLSLACALQDSPLKIAVIDRATPPPKESWQGFDARVSAIVKSSENFMRNTGVWDFIETQRHCAYHGMDVWEQDGTASIQFDSADIAHTELGYIIENRIMQWAMLERLKSAKHLQWFCPEAITTLDNISGGNFSSANLSNPDHSGDANWRIQFESGNELKAKLLIGADGAMSFIRQQLNIDVKQLDLEHKAIVCNVECEKPHGNIARQIFLNSGPLALLPLAENPNACSIVWSADHEKAETLLALNESEFCQQLGKQFEYRLGAITQADQRFSFPLYQRHAHTYISDDAALIGDAAHTIHPLAGQGVNLGYMDAAVLAEEIMRAQKRNISISNKEVLRRYERRRRGQVTLMMNTMRGFQKLFSVKQADVIGLRNLGMKLTNKATPVKNHILSRAMGIGGDVPEIAKL